MRKALIGVAGASLLLLGATGASASDVNCGLVNKDLAMGRTAVDISERMMIPIDEVRKCQEMGKPGADAPSQDEVKGAAKDKATGAASGAAAGAAGAAMGH